MAQAMAGARSKLFRLLTLGIFAIWAIVCPCRMTLANPHPASPGCCCCSQSSSPTIPHHAPDCVHCGTAVVAADHFAAHINLAVDFSGGLIVQLQILRARVFEGPSASPDACQTPNQPSLLSLYCALML
jgi:hypothetical protein